MFTAFGFFILNTLFTVFSVFDMSLLSPVLMVEMQPQIGLILMQYATLLLCKDDKG